MRLVSHPIINRLIPGSSHLVAVFRWEKRLLARFMLTSIARTMAAMAVVYFIQEFMSNMLGTGQGRITALISQHFGRSSSLYTNIILLFAASVCGALFNYDSQVVQQRLIKLFELGTMDRLIRHLLLLSVPFINSQSPGDLIQAVRHDVSSLRRTVHSLATILLEGLQAAGLISVAFWVSPWLAFWSLIALPVVSLPIVWVARAIRAKSFTIRKTGYVFFDVILQILSGIRVLKVYRAEEREAQITAEKGNHYFDEMIESVRLRSLGQVLLESLAGLGLVAVIIIGSFQVKAGSLTAAGLFAFAMAAKMLTGTVNNIYMAYMEMQNYTASVDRITELLQTKPQVFDHPESVALESAPKQIAFRDVCFAYDETHVLKSISFKVNAGEAIGIIGPSGAGKSSLLNLVARFYDPTSGEILYDGRPLNRFRLADIYDQFAIVTQEPFLFATTVKENIRVGRPDATDAEVEQAARAAYVHSTILDLPQGYDTAIGFNGRTLSRGQAQRINLARAFIKRAPIILLDEPTSSLDAIGESEVQQAMVDLMKGRTSFLVTHRFSNLKSADRILILNDGECAGIGTHEELYRGCKLYRKMYDIQRLEESADKTEHANLTVPSTPCGA